MLQQAAWRGVGVSGRGGCGFWGGGGGLGAGWGFRGGGGGFGAGWVGVWELEHTQLRAPRDGGVKPTRLAPHPAPSPPGVAISTLSAATRAASSATFLPPMRRPADSSWRRPTFTSSSKIWGCVGGKEGLGFVRQFSKEFYSGFRAGGGRFWETSKPPPSGPQNRSWCFVRVSLHRCVPKN